MIIEATKQGFSAARANWKLIAALWLLNVAVVLTAAIPGWVALGRAMGNLPLADSLARTFSFGVLADLTELNPGLLEWLGGAAAASLVLAFLAAIGFAGGALEVLSAGPAEGFAERFGRGFFRFYGRFLRLAIATTVLAAVTMGVVAGPLFALRGYVRREYGSEWLTLGMLGAAIAGGGLMLLLALLAQDAARVMIVRGEVRGVLRALMRGAALVWRHPFTWLGAWSVNTILLAVALAVYLAVADATAAFALLAISLLVRQVFVAIRCALRIAFLGAEWALVPVAPGLEAVPENAVSVEPPPSSETLERPSTWQDEVELQPEAAVPALPPTS